MKKKSIVFSVLVVAAACARAPEPGTPPSPQRNAQGAGGDTARAGGDSARGGAAAPAQPRAYNRVITREAKTRRGMFTG